MDAPEPSPVTYSFHRTSFSTPERADEGSIDTEGEWYLVEGVRYCLRCQSRRCERQFGGTLRCVEPAR